MHSRVIVPAAVIVFLMGLAPVLGKGGRGGGGFGGGMHRDTGGSGWGDHPSQGATRPTTPAPASQPAASTQPTKDDLITAAQLEVKSARKALTDLTAQIKTQYEQSAPFTEALAQQKQAQDAYDSAYQTDVATLKSSATYQQAVQDRIAAQKKVDELHAAGSTGSPEVMQASQASLAASQKIKQMEAGALATDPNIVRLRTAINDANLRLNTLRKNFDASLATNSYWLAAKKDLDDARAKLDMLEKGD